jgi:hypothetical protein
MNELDLLLSEMQSEADANNDQVVEKALELLGIVTRQDELARNLLRKELSIQHQLCEAFKVAVKVSAPAKPVIKVELEESE